LSVLWVAYATHSTLKSFVKTVTNCRVPQQVRNSLNSCGTGRLWGHFLLHGMWSASTSNLHFVFCRVVLQLPNLPAAYSTPAVKRTVRNCQHCVELEVSLSAPPLNSQLVNTAHVPFWVDKFSR
jgi:hypothetical protein